MATGIAGLDALFFGGIRRGNLVLVKGAPGSGKTLLGTEFIYRGATRYGEPGLIVVFESNSVLLRRDVAAFGWNLADLEQQGSVKIIATVLKSSIRNFDPPTASSCKRPARWAPNGSLWTMWRCSGR